MKTVVAKCVRARASSGVPRDFVGGSSARSSRLLTLHQSSANWGNFSITVSKLSGVTTTSTSASIIAFTSSISYISAAGGVTLSGRRRAKSLTILTNIERRFQSWDRRSFSSRLVFCSCKSSMSSGRILIHANNAASNASAFPYSLETHRAARGLWTASLMDDIRVTRG